MKRLLALLTALMLMLCLSPSVAEQAGEPSILVVVFSHAGENWQVGVVEEGNTMKMAKIIAEQLHAELFEIVPEIPYPVGYEEMKDIAQKELDEDARPAYVGDVENWETVDTVFIGYPIWWGGMPKIVQRFLENHDFTGKTVIPFNTHGGSGQGGTQTVIEQMLTGAKVLKGLAVNGVQAQNDPEKTLQDVESWLKSIGLSE
jgi:flavodoxin